LATIDNIGKIHIRATNNSKVFIMGGKNISLDSKGINCKNVSIFNNMSENNSKKWTFCKGQGTLNISGEHLKILGKDNVFMSAEGKGRIVLIGNNKNNASDKNK